jgi:hypothetical protein
MESVENVATPFIALVVTVPPSVPPLGLLAIAIEIEAELPAAVLPSAS